MMEVDDEFFGEVVCPEKVLAERTLKISIEIERLLASGTDVIDATLTVAERYDLEVEVIAELLHKNVIDKIFVEASRNNSLKGGRKERYLNIFDV